ncbi:glycosyltransferase family 2 protein [Marinobacter sp.]|uniref:glycosyltransferase family 2 protein n=1 Tax=Marinobacter sp. TaxID=50741 RepID=UPI003A900104
MSKISVVIPVYNRACWIGETLERIFQQEQYIHEVVVCDDGSTDALLEALKPYGDRIKLVTIENSGPAIARKTAINHATGDWLALCDSDDFWHENHLNKFLEALSLFPEMDFYFSDFYATDVPEHSKFTSAPAGWLESLDSGESYVDYIKCNSTLYQALLKFQPCFPSACLFSRTLYEQVGGIDSEVSRWPSEDFHLTIRLAAVANAVICTVPTVTINKHDQNFSADVLANFAGRIDILDKIIGDAPIRGDLIKMTRQEVGVSKLELFRLYYWHKDYQNMRMIFFKVPSRLKTLKDYLRFIKGVVFSVREN